MSEQSILDFCLVTGASTEEAITYIQIADGDVETAVTLYLENGDSRHDRHDESNRHDSLSALNTSSQTPEHDLLDHYQAKNDTVRAPIASRHDILSGPMFSEGSLWGQAPTVTRSIFNQGDSSTSAPVDYRSDVTFHPSSADPIPSVTDNSKSRRLADLFRPPFDIMFCGTFEEARETAKTKNRWLLINIQDPTEFSCQILNRDLWSDTIVKEVVRESFVFLQYTRESPEGKRYLTLYPIQSYPHVACIDARTGERIKVWEKALSSADFIMEATECLEAGASGNVRPTTMKRARVTKDVMDMSEEEQINAAIEASLKRSSSDTDTDTSTVSTPPTQDTLYTHSHELTAMEGQEEEQEEGQEEEQEMVHPHKEVSILNAIQPVQREEPTDLALSTRIQLRLPDGKRIIRRFLKTDPVRHLFEFVKTQVPETQQQPFELVFNRQQLIDVLDQPIHEAGLENAAVHFVFT
ncbi:hypothetical protein BDF14DRAFT_1870558 [Spinellus fusiger]|nr:hypothetical protein BDF14DRAFT_1870558 [Spinellus fusiger]